MTTFVKQALAPGGVVGNGTPILMNISGTPTAIHSGASTDAAYDEVWLYAHNYDTTARELTIQFGGTASKDQIIQLIPAKSGLILVCPGLVLRGASTPLVIQGFAATATSIAISGYVNRIS